MNEASYNGWLDEQVYHQHLHDAMCGDAQRIDADQQLADVVADGAYDAGFAAGAEAQKNGLAYA